MQSRKEIEAEENRKAERRLYMKQYMAERRRRKKLLEEKLESEEHFLFPVNKENPSECKRFRKMIEKKIPLDLEFKHGHISESLSGKCECYQFMLSLKPAKGVNLWNNK